MTKIKTAKEMMQDSPLLNAELQDFMQIEIDKLRAANKDLDGRLQSVVFQNQRKNEIIGELQKDLMPQGRRIDTELLTHWLAIAMVDGDETPFSKVWPVVVELAAAHGAKKAIADAPEGKTK